MSRHPWFIVTRKNKGQQIAESRTFDETQEQAARVWFEESSLYWDEVVLFNGYVVVKDGPIDERVPDGEESVGDEVLVRGRRISQNGC